MTTALLSNEFANLAVVLKRTDRNRFKKTLARFAAYYDIPSDRTVLEQSKTLAVGETYNVVLPSSPAPRCKLLVVRATKALPATLVLPGDPTDVTVETSIDTVLVWSGPVVSLELDNPSVEGAESVDISVIVF